MSELFEDDPQDAPPQRRGRLRWLVLAGVVLILLYFAVTTFASIYTDGLWYGAVGYGEVFSTVLRVRIVLFVVFGLLMAAAIVVPSVLAYRGRPFFHPADEHGNLERYRDAITPIRTWLLVGVAGIALIFAGVSGAGHWRTYLLWRHGGSFHEKDPFFGKDVGFYVFDLPWWHYLVNFALTGLVLGVLASAVVHYLFGGIRLGSSRDRFSRSAQVQLSILIGLLLLVKGIDYWLDRFDLVYNSGPALDGMGYTDDHAVLPAKNILAAIAVICAVLFFLNIWRRSWQLPTVGVSLLVVSTILIGLIWPAIVQALQVKPSQSDKERPYLAANIAATRTAYDIDSSHVTQRDYTSQASASTPATALDGDLSDVPVVDPALAYSEFERVQQGRAYYTVRQPLDVDHYDIDGRDRALVLGVRELNQGGISASDRTWTNLHTVYTHSNGVIAAYANQRERSDAAEHSDTQWAEATGRDDISNGSGFQDQVYFGEDSPDYSVVGRPPGAKPVELDYRNGRATTTTYRGAGGVSLGSTFRRMMFAIKFSSANFFLSERVNDHSEILYNRTPQQRVEKVAPWLALDNDVYPVVVNGRILWVVDGYTTTDRYPQSARDSFTTMTDDALVTNGSSRTLPATDDINYMRNAVKATVDAYDGTVTLYAWDDSDPMLRAWEAVFPHTVMPKSAIPPELLAHLRYPDDMYKVQRYQLAKYHVTDAVDFLNGTDRWDVPEDPNIDGHLQSPYRTFLDDGDRKTWSLTSTFVPSSRQNLAAIMSVDSDATDPKNYGKIQLLTGFGQEVQGPGLVNSALRTNSRTADAVAQFSRSSGTALWGQVLTIPTRSHGLVYIEPVYATRSTVSSSSYARLAYVLVSYAGRIGYGPTLAQALSDALRSTPAKTGQEQGGKGANANPGKGTPGSGGQGHIKASVRAQISGLLADAQHLYARANTAAHEGNFELRERLLRQAERKVNRAAQLLQQ